MMPSYKTLRARFCGQNETGTEAQGLAAGYVRDAAGNPVPNAHVWATWQVLWVPQNGRLVAANQQRTVETDTGGDGSYLMCGIRAREANHRQSRDGGAGDDLGESGDPSEPRSRARLQVRRPLVARRHYAGAFHH